MDSATCPFRSRWTSIFNVKVRWRRINYLQFQQHQTKVPGVYLLSPSHLRVPRALHWAKAAQLTSYLLFVGQGSDFLFFCKAPRRLCICPWIASLVFPKHWGFSIPYSLIMSHCFLHKFMEPQSVVQACNLSTWEIRQEELELKVNFGYRASLRLA